MRAEVATLLPSSNAMPRTLEPAANRVHSPRIGGRRGAALAAVALLVLTAAPRPTSAGEAARFFGWSGDADASQKTGGEDGKTETTPTENGVLDELGDRVDEMWGLPWVIPVAVSDELAPRLDDWPMLQQSVRFWGCYGEEMSGRGVDLTGAPVELDAMRACAEARGGAAAARPATSSPPKVVELVVVGETCRRAQPPQRALALPDAQETCASLCQTLPGEFPASTPIVIDATEGAHGVVETLRDCLSAAGFERPAVKSR